MELLIGDGGVGEGAVRDVVINRWHRGQQQHFGKLSSTVRPDGEVLPSTRRSIFMQMFDQLYDSVPPRRLRQSRRPWRIEFEGEGGQDAGGLFSESLSMLVDDIVNSCTHLFCPSPNAAQLSGTHQDCVMPAPSACKPGDLAMFEFVGRLMGVGVRLGFPLPLRLPPLLWKQFVGAAADVHDLRSLDHKLFTHLQAVSTVSVWWLLLLFSCPLLTHLGVFAGSRSS